MIHLLGCQSRSNKNFPKESVLRKCSPSPLTASVFLILKFQYKMDPAQMKFLRLLSMRITQNITYHCYNSRAWEEEDDRTIKLQGDNDMELTSSEKTKPKVVSDNCDVSILVLFFWIATSVARVCARSCVLNQLPADNTSLST